MGLNLTRNFSVRPAADHAADSTAQRPPRAGINVLGVRVDVLNLRTATDAIADAVDTRRRGYVTVTGVHGVMESQRDPHCRAIHNAASLVTPDGMPLAWLLKLAGHREADRVYGPDLMLSVFAHGESRGFRHFLYGASEDTLARLRTNLLKRFPGALIVGSHAPPFRPLTDAETVSAAAAINASGADIVWVGLSTPKQEFWMARSRDLLDAPMLIGVGAAFDFHAGLKPQAPAVLQRAGMEWLFRLACEPRRLWRRYLTNNPRFVVAIAAQVLGLRKY
jgi:N-acetylglucosaminyldiphosphoundecaprenol N-acetyl-beta-D-mannosaminyltransferase